MGEWWEAIMPAPSQGIMDPSSPDFFGGIGSVAPVVDLSSDFVGTQTDGSFLDQLRDLFSTGGGGGQGGIGGWGSAILGGFSALNSINQFLTGREARKTAKWQRAAAQTVDRRGQYDTWLARKSSQAVRGNNNFPTWDQWSAQAGGRLI